jgi:hypothetical protein
VSHSKTKTQIGTIRRTTLTSRKERRARQHEREQLGLPKAKPWTYRKEDGVLRRGRLMEMRDQQLAKAIGIPLAVVQQIRKSVTTMSDVDVSVVQSQ